MAESQLMTTGGGGFEPNAHRPEPRKGIKAKATFSRGLDKFGNVFRIRSHEGKRKKAALRPSSHSPLSSWARMDFAKHFSQSWTSLATPLQRSYPVCLHRTGTASPLNDQWAGELTPNTLHPPSSLCTPPGIAFRTLAENAPLIESLPPPPFNESPGRAVYRTSRTGSYGLTCSASTGCSASSGRTQVAESV